jgi:hypothetical protein
LSADQPSAVALLFQLIDTPCAAKGPKVHDQKATNPIPFSGSDFEESWFAMPRITFVLQGILLSENFTPSHAEPGLGKDT